MAERRRGACAGRSRGAESAEVVAAAAMSFCRCPSSSRGNAPARSGAARPSPGDGAGAAAAPRGGARRGRRAKVAARTPGCPDGGTAAGPAAEGPAGGGRWGPVSAVAWPWLPRPLSRYREGRAVRDCGCSCAGLSVTGCIKTVILCNLTPSDTRCYLV